MDVEQIGNEIIKNPAWSAVAARRCLRAHFKCEYCGLDFLESPTAYNQIQFDHIVPKASGGSDDEENIATVCRTRNMDWKSRWDPRTTAAAGRSRDELVAACKQHLREKREEFLREIARIRSILDAAQPAAERQGVGRT